MIFPDISYIFHDKNFLCKKYSPFILAFPTWLGFLLMVKVERGEEPEEQNQTIINKKSVVPNVPNF